jgi:hypothetical protein
MTATIADPFLQGSTGRNTRGLLRITILCLIAAAAVASRLFSVIRKSSPVNKRSFRMSALAPIAGVASHINLRRLSLQSITNC